MEYLPKNCELIIVDQSQNDDTADVLSPDKIDNRFKYIRSLRSGVSAVRNKVIRQAESKWIFITDDDCEMYPDTFTEMIGVLNSDQNVGIIFGNVFAGPYEPSAGIVPSYIRKSHFLARNISDKINVEGLSACMVIHKKVWEDLNGFDELLGVGAPLKSAAETEFTMRCLLSGYPVLETPKIRILHHGFRNWEQVRSLLIDIGLKPGRHLLDALSVGVSPFMF
jgi:GT2 family glycosyltransferase